MRTVWLVSYPKSGNTWVRALMSNYRLDQGKPIDINAQLDGSAIHLNRHRFDEFFGFSSSELTPELLERFRRKYHEEIARQFSARPLFKVHERYVGTATGQPLFPPEPDACVVYIVRNPIDVVPSLSAHLNITMDQAIDRLQDPDARSYFRAREFSEYLGRWCDHVTEWLDQTDIPVIMVRYEDLSDDPAGALERILRAADLGVDHDRIQRAVDRSRFKTLQSLEAQSGFREWQRPGAAFFRKGRPNEGKRVLTQNQLKGLVAANGKAMSRLGYDNDI